MYIQIFILLYIFYISDTYTSERESNRAIRNEHLFNSLFLMSSSSLLMLQQSLQELTQVRNRFTKTFSAQFISSNHYTHNCSLPVTHTLQEHCAQLSSSLVLLGSQIQINYSVAASATLGEKKKKLQQVQQNTVSMLGVVRAVICGQRGLAFEKGSHAKTAFRLGFKQPLLRN